MNKRLQENKSINPAYERQRVSWPMQIVAPILFPPLFFIRKLQNMDKFSSKRQSSDGRQEHIFFIRRLQVMAILRVLIKETIRRLQVMVRVMNPFSTPIKETIMRWQVMVQGMDLFSVLIKVGDHHEIAAYGPLQSSHHGHKALIDHWESWTWSGDLRANERPQKQIALEGNKIHTWGRTSGLLERIRLRADSLKMYKSSRVHHYKSTKKQDNLRTCF